MTASPPSRTGRQRFIPDLLGLSVKEFLAGVQEQKAYGPHRTAPRLDAANVAVMADVDYLLCHSKVPASDVHVIDGPSVWRDRRVIGQNGAINSAYVYERFVKGASIRLLGVHRHLPRVAGLAGELAAALAARVGANIYLSPAGAMGLRPHYDGHDVLVLQCAGVKRWQIYADFAPAVQLPTNDVLKFDPTRHKPGRVGREVRMKAGDVLYLPRGLMHTAEAEGAPSLHVTFSLNTLTLGELLQCALRLAVEEDVQLRREVPLEMRLSPEAFDADAVASVAAQALASSGRMQRALEICRQEWEKAKTPPADHWFAAHGTGRDGMARLEGAVAARVRAIRRAANRPDGASPAP